MDHMVTLNRMYDRINAHDVGARSTRWG